MRAQTYHRWWCASIAFPRQAAVVCGALHTTALVSSAEREFLQLLTLMAPAEWARRGAAAGGAV